MGSRIQIAMGHRLSPPEKNKKRISNPRGFSSQATLPQLEKLERQASGVGLDSGSPAVDAPDSRLPAALED